MRSGIGLCFGVPPLGGVLFLVPLVFYRARLTREPRSVGRGMRGTPRHFFAVNVYAPTESTDSGGDALKFDTRRAAPADDGEALYTGTTDDGTAFVLLAQSALPVVSGSSAAPADPSALESAQGAPGNVPDELLAPYTTADEPAKFSVGYTADELVFDATLLEPQFAFAVTATTAAFSWVPQDDILEWKIVRDGEIQTATTETTWSVDELEAGATYVVEILGLDVNGTVAASRTIPVETLAADASRGSIVVPLTYQQYTTAFTYETFIADNRVSLGLMETIGCGQTGFPNRSFGGDNRSYVTPVMAPYDTPNYRTMLFVNVNWDNPAPYDMVIDGGIGTTRLYDGTTLIETRTATFDNTTIDNTYKSGAYAQTHWAHSVGNPFCIAGAITYDVTVRFYRSGTVEIVG